MWARDILRDAHLAEDAVQESFLRLADKLPGLRDPERFRPWLRRLVRRTAINMLRGAENRTKRFGDLPESADPYLASRPEEPLQEILGRESRREVRTARSQLCAATRNVSWTRWRRGCSRMKPRRRSALREATSIT